VNGARGVIINVTGGPDLSLVEVSDASTIVQEAADEDATIIFGAVVDPTLAGKVKITVIATGFGPVQLPRPAASGAQTPIDMSSYSEQSRLRADAAAAVTERVAPRMSLARRSLLDVPASVVSAPVFAGSAPAQSGQGLEADLELNAAFDVPAFLRRQES
jgi:cell division protein FtsZ